MAKFIKGVSGNPAGRPKGSGSKQRMTKRKEHEAAMLLRFQTGLAELDDWHFKRVQIIEDYICGSEQFPPE